MPFVCLLIAVPVGLTCLKRAMQLRFSALLLYEYARHSYCTHLCVCVWTWVPFTLIRTSSPGSMRTWCSGSRMPEPQSFTANPHDSCLDGMYCMYASFTLLNSRLWLVKRASFGKEITCTCTWRAPCFPPSSYQLQEAQKKRSCYGNAVTQISSGFSFWGLVLLSSQGLFSSATVTAGSGSRNISKYSKYFKMLCDWTINGAI